MQVAPHGLKPSLQTHRPPLQLVFGGQMLPHCPQFVVVSIAVQTPPQHAWLSPHGVLSFWLV